MVTLAPISSVPPSAVEVRTTLLPNEVLPAKTISPVPLMPCEPAPRSTRLAPLPRVDRVTSPPASTSPPLAMSSVAALPTTTSPPSVMPVKVTVAPAASVATRPTSVSTVAL